ncbi:hypothetical protein DFH06DRAFT_432259 [Mycena polygramma]|nr:hypothetical protein DFH06DRAFT_432259 [Mycena polygramma]
MDWRATCVVQHNRPFPFMASPQSSTIKVVRHGEVSVFRFAGSFAEITEFQPLSKAQNFAGFILETEGIVMTSHRNGTEIELRSPALPDSSVGGDCTHQHIAFDEDGSGFTVESAEMTVTNRYDKTEIAYRMNVAGSTGPPDSSALEKPQHQCNTGFTLQTAGYLITNHCDGGRVKSEVKPLSRPEGGGGGGDCMQIHEDSITVESEELIVTCRGYTTEIMWRPDAA